MFSKNMLRDSKTDTIRIDLLSIAESFFGEDTAKTLDRLYGNEDQKELYRVVTFMLRKREGYTKAKKIMSELDDKVAESYSA